MVLFLAWGPMAALLGWLLVVKPILVLGRNPARDVLRIKRDFEGQGRTVTNVRRNGTDWGREFVAPTYRRYAVTVRRQNGQTADFAVGVAFGFASDADLSEDDAAARKAFFRGASEIF